MKLNEFGKSVIAALMAALAAAAIYTIFGERGEAFVMVLALTAFVLFVAGPWIFDDDKKKGD